MVINKAEEDLFNDWPAIVAPKYILEAFLLKRTCAREIWKVTMDLVKKKIMERALALVKFGLVDDSSEDEEMSSDEELETEDSDCVCLGESEINPNVEILHYGIV